jgi:hypothetical protein
MLRLKEYVKKNRDLRFPNGQLTIIQLMMQLYFYMQF